MPFSLPVIIRQNRRIRRDIALRPIHTSKAQAADLASILLRTVKLWQAGIPRIMASYEPQTRDGLTRDGLPDITAALDAITAEVDRIILTVSAQLRNWSVRTEAWHRGKWLASVNAGAGVDLSTVLTAVPVQETLEAWLARNVALVRDVSDQARGRMAEVLFREYQLGTAPRKVGRMLEDVVGLARDRARRIAADQAVKLSSQLDRERHAEAGIEMVKWRHSGKLHARPWHKARDGKIYDLKTGEQVDALTGEVLEGGEEIDADDRAGVAPFCGCVEQAYIPWLE